MKLSELTQDHIRNIKLTLSADHVVVHQTRLLDSDKVDFLYMPIFSKSGESFIISDKLGFKLFLRRDTIMTVGSTNFLVVTNDGSESYLFVGVSSLGKYRDTMLATIQNKIMRSLIDPKNIDKSLFDEDNEGAVILEILSKLSSRETYKTSMVYQLSDGKKVSIEAELVGDLEDDIANKRLPDSCNIALKYGDQSFSGSSLENVLVDLHYWLKVNSGGSSDGRNHNRWNRPI